MIVGFVGTVRDNDVPTMFESVAEQEDGTLLAGEDMVITQAEFHDLVQNGDWTRLARPVEADPDRVWVLFPGTAQAVYERFDFLDVLLNRWVDQHRVDGYLALRSGSVEQAQKMFDQARRVSNEVDDYVRVWALEPDAGMRDIWADWLNRTEPGLNLELKALTLGLHEDPVTPVDLAWTPYRTRRSHYATVGFVEWNFQAGQQCGVRYKPGNPNIVEVQYPDGKILELNRLEWRFPGALDSKTMDEIAIEDIQTQEDARMLAILERTVQDSYA